MVRDYPAPDLWCLLQCERDEERRLGHSYHSQPWLANIEAEWERRGVCSSCFEQMTDANPRAQDLLRRISELEAENEELLARLEQPVRIGFGPPA